LKEININTLSLLWKLLVIFISILNTYIIFKYFLETYLLKNKPKYFLEKHSLKNKPKKIAAPLSRPLIYVYLFFIIIYLISFPVSFYLSESSKIYELIKVFTVSNNIDPFIRYFCLISMFVLVLMCSSPSINKKSIVKTFHKFIIFLLIPFSLMMITTGLGAILYNKISPPLSVLSIDLKIFIIYRLLVLPGIYLGYSLILLFVFKGKLFSPDGYNKKREIVSILKNSLLFFYLIFMIYAIYFIIEYANSYDTNAIQVFLYRILTYTFLFITIYAGFAYCVSRINNKNGLFDNLFKKALLFYSLSLIALWIIPLVLYKIDESGINVTTVIVTAILITISAYIINTIISRVFR